VEAVLKTCPIVESICLFADSTREFVVAIVVPAIAELSKLSDKPAAEVIKDPKIREEVVKLLQNYGINQRLLKVEMPFK
jgi:long-chain acyl-CoA synthetase